MLQQHCSRLISWASSLLDRSTISSIRCMLNNFPSLLGNPPILIFSSKISSSRVRNSVPLFLIFSCRFVLLLAIEYAWNVFPSTHLSSSILLGANSLLLVGVWLSEDKVDNKIKSSWTSSLYDDLCNARQQKRLYIDISNKRAVSQSPLHFLYSFLYTRPPVLSGGSTRLPIQDKAEMTAWYAAFGW